MKFTKLDPVFKAEWVRALRSRIYRQGKGQLKKTPAIATWIEQNL